MEHVTEEDRSPQAKEMWDVKASIERLAKQHVEAGKSWDKAVRWTKFLKKVQGERDKARRERGRLKEALLKIATLAGDPDGGIEGWHEIRAFAKRCADSIEEENG